MNKLRKLFRTAVIVVVAGLLLGSSLFTPAQGQNENPGFAPENRTLNAVGRSGFLTGPNAAAPLEIAQRYLRDNLQAFGLTGADLVDAVVTDQYTDRNTGVTHIYLRQRFAQIEVFGAEAGVHIAADGSVISANASFIPNLAAAIRGDVPGRTARDAVVEAARKLGIAVQQEPKVAEVRGGPAREVIFEPSGISLERIPVKLMYQPVAPGVVKLAWDMNIYEPDALHWWSLRVDARTGAILSQVDWVDTEADLKPSAGTGALRSSDKRSLVMAGGGTYNVFAYPLESPSDGPRTFVTDPAITSASPYGWHDVDGMAGADYTTTRGNNVDAHTDLDANNKADPGSAPDGGAGLIFDYSLDLSQGPETYRPAAVTNLFYWNNIVHDVLAGYGFDEASGNFQTFNYSGSGLGRDNVEADAQDGSGTDNANFATPPDGVRPRMQMYVWQYPLQNTVLVNQPATIAGPYEASGAVFGPSLSQTGPVSGSVAPVDDGTGVVTDACETLSSFPAGSIALIDRGTCNFTVKVYNAQVAGAAAVIMVNNVAGSPFTMGGDDRRISIPSVMVSLDTGNLFKANLTGLQVTLKYGSTRPSRDSDLDSGVIAHEYGHGVSNRLTGGPHNTACLMNDEQMGEGWSDFLALAFTSVSSDTAATSRGIGTYVIFEDPTGIGIRPTQYTTDLNVNPITFADISGLAVPHGVGYAWASMLWEVYWNLVNKYGYNPDLSGDWTTGGNNLTLQLVIDGMKYQPCRPGFVDGRDAILQADLVRTGGANQCEIWAGFAKRGLGYSASQGTSRLVTDQVEAFDLPPACTPAP